MHFIAEIGLNHHGDEARALRMLDAVCAAGVDAVTFQVREPKFYDGSSPWRRPLRTGFYAEAAQHAASKGVPLGLALADLAALPDLRGAASFWKTLSWDLPNEPLQAALEATGKPVWISTGVSSLEDVVEASRRHPNAAFIHTQLSASLDDVNLQAVETMRRATGRPVAFGLHCDVHDVLRVALGLRPDAYFVYVKEDVAGKQPDDAHAVRTADLPELLRELQRLEKALGDGRKERMEKKL